MNHDLPPRIAASLEKDEEVVWLGQPARQAAFVKRLPTILLWLVAFVIAWSFRAELAGLWRQAFGEHARAEFVVSAGLLLIGLCEGLTLVSLFRGLWRDPQTWYVVTSRRAIVLPPDMFGVDRQRSFTPAELEHAQVFQGWLGIGDVIFDSQVRWGMTYQRRSRMSVLHRGFRNITNAHAREVAAIIADVLLSPVDRRREQAERTAARTSLCPFSVAPRPRSIARPGDERFEIVPTPNSRLLGLMYPVLLLVLLGLLYGASTAAPTKQVLRSLPPAAASALSWGVKGIAAVVTVVFLAGTVLHVGERKAWFDRESGRFQPSGMLPGTFPLAGVRGVQLLHLKKGVGSSSAPRQWHEINLVFEGPTRKRVHICSFDVPQKKSDKGRSPGDPPERVARELAAFLRVSLLD